MPVLMKVAQKMFIIIRVVCFDSVGYPIILINLILMFLIAMLKTVTRTVTKLVR